MTANAAAQAPDYLDLEEKLRRLIDLQAACKRVISIHEARLIEIGDEIIATDKEMRVMAGKALDAIRAR